MPAVKESTPAGEPPETSQQDMQHISKRGETTMIVHATGERTTIQFAHPSEEEFARLFDYYGIRWEYEPHSFPIEWDENGRPIRYFTPDFYLPDYDLYVEVTTLKQKLITPKHRKIRKLRQLYPHLRIKLLNAKDFHQLMLKYNAPLSPTEQESDIKAHKNNS